MKKHIQINPFHVMDILARCKEMEAQGRDVVHMEIGEPDFSTPQPIIDAGISVLNEKNTYYTSAQGLYELRENICAYYKEKFSITVVPEQIIVTPGASGALQLVLLALLQNKHQLMLGDPTYPCNRNLSRLFGGGVVSVPVDDSTEFQLTTSLVKKHWCDSVSAVLVASPSNPTGTICKLEELLEIADFLASKNKYLIVDEIYQGLTYSKAATSVAALRDNIFVLNSFSKYFGMTGWRVGWLVAPSSHISELDAISQNTYLATSTIAQHAALAAFKVETIETLEQRRNIFQQRRDLVCDLLSDLGIDVPTIPQGAFYIYANISKHTDDSFDFCKQLLERKAVAITPGCDFGDYRANEFVRFAYTTNEERLKLGLLRLKEFLY
ncbi:MAG: aminotransferase class I/II-fold pyridoxal phosphate-dependent enzyme [Pseudomonadota bacterium]